MSAAGNPSRGWNEDRASLGAANRRGQAKAPSSQSLRVPCDRDSRKRGNSLPAQLRSGYRIPESRSELHVVRYDSAKKHAIRRGTGREAEEAPNPREPLERPMPSRRKPPPTKSVLPATRRSLHGSRSGKGRRPAVSRDTAARRWRRDSRPRLVRAIVSATKALKWSHPLIEAVLEELYVDDHFEELLGRAPGELRPGQYAQAIAVALLLRHSWHPDDLACMLKRLKLRVGDA